MPKRSDDSQLDLFGAPPPSAAPPVAPPSWDERLLATAERLPANVRFGTSSWTYAGWADLVYRLEYKSQASFVRESLREYARHPLFRTVGIDRSFYGPLREEELMAHAAQLPEAFPVCAKVWQEISTFAYPNHPRLGEKAGRRNARFLDPGLFLETVGLPYERAFQAHAGPLIVEITRAPMRIEPRELEAHLVRFLEATPPGLRFAFELRDPRLLTPRYIEVLEDHGASHVVSFWSQMPGLRQQYGLARAAKTPHLVVRLLLPPGKEHEALEAEFAPFDRLRVIQEGMRRDTTAIARDAAAEGKEVFVLVSNKVEGSAPLTVRALAEALVTGV